MPPNFVRRLLQPFGRLLIASTVVIFVVETLIMLVAQRYAALLGPYTVYLDGLVLSILLLPLNYVFLVRPLAREYAQRQRTHQQLINANQILECFFSSKEALIAFLDADFVIQRLNPAFAAAQQQDAAAFIGRGFFDCFPIPALEAPFRQARQTASPVSATAMPLPLTSPAAPPTFWDWRLLPVTDPSGAVVQLLLLIYDVTARQHAQEALAASERRFRAVFNQTFQHMGLLDPNGRTLLLNQTALRFAGLPLEQLSARPFWELPWWPAPSPTADPPPDTLQQVVRQAAQLTILRRQQVVQPTTGEAGWMELTLKPLLDDRGHTDLIIYEARDITESLLAEYDLRQSRAEIQRLYLAEQHARQRADVLRRAIQGLTGSLDLTQVMASLLDYLDDSSLGRSAHILLLADERLTREPLTREPFTRDPLSHPSQLAVRFARGEDDWPPDLRLAGRCYDDADFPWFERVLYANQVVSVPDTAAAPPWQFFHPAIPIRSWLAVPLQTGELVIGLCLLENRQPGFFTPERIEWAELLITQASVAIHNAWLFEQVRNHRTHLQALSRQLVETQEHERRYIAQELHDDAGQALTSLMLGLHQLENVAQEPAAVMEHCRQLKQVTDGVLENIHRLAVNLRPASLDHLGLVAALRQHAAAVSQQHGLRVQFATLTEIERLPNAIETAIYRIVQESLTNILRHAHATQVDILLECRDRRLVVVIEDNGVGFALGFDPRAPLPDQLGILGMHERAEMLGGQLTIESAPGHGATIVLEVPCPLETPCPSAS